MTAVEPKTLQVGNSRGLETPSVWKCNGIRSGAEVNLAIVSAGDARSFVCQTLQLFLRSASFIGAHFVSSAITAAVELRHRLHQHPELSGYEVQTAAAVSEFFAALTPDESWHGLGGHGVAFAFDGTGPGPTLLLRAELDALPISEPNELAYRSQRAGVAHKCGHDGHMAILAALAVELAERRPSRGRVVLLFQPAEETGAGARAVVRDPRFAEIAPDFVYALHNLPGLPLGQIVVREHTMCCASTGMIVSLHGRSAHAAQPETGISPANAMCALIAIAQSLSDRVGVGEELAFATVVGARLGDAVFGTAPDSAQVMLTLRAETDATLERMQAELEAQATAIVRAEGLTHDIAYHDVFRATTNSSEAVSRLRRAVAGMPIVELDQPLRWSEDFGRFTALAEGALFGLGAGEQTPALHDENYDFPDALIPVGAEVFSRLVESCLGGARRP